MDLIDEIKALSDNVSKQAENIKTEEATKNALVMPFIRALGYNVFDPTEVVPEFTADIGTKKGEKVDYAIIKDNKPIMLFECKKLGINLDKEHKAQLYRYFSVTETRFGVLTNGVIYRFYTDIEESNKMDSKPFFEFNLLDFSEAVVDDLKRFSKSVFDLDGNLTAATELKYTKEIKKLFAEQMINPSENFVRFFASQVYAGKLTQPIKQLFSNLTKKALNQFANDRVNARLKSALVVEEATITPLPSNAEELPNDKSNKENKKSKINTTGEELEGHKIIQEVLEGVVESDKVVMRDAVSYCAILFDNNNRKPICRLYFNSANNKKIGLFDQDRNEEKIPIKEVSEIHNYADRLKNAVSGYLPK